MEDTFETEHQRAEMWKRSAIATDEDYQEEVKKNLKLADEKRMWWEQYNKAVEALAREYDIKVELLRRVEELEDRELELMEKLHNTEGELVIAQENLSELQTYWLDKSYDVEAQIGRIEEAAYLLDSIAGELRS